MSLNKLTDINQKKGWMNIRCNEIKCEALSIAGAPVGGGDVNNNVGWSNGTQYNITIGETPLFDECCVTNAVPRGNGGTKIGIFTTPAPDNVNFIEIYESGVYEFSGRVQYVPQVDMEGGVLVLQYEDDTGQKAFLQRPRHILTTSGLGVMYQLSVLEINEVIAPARIKLVLQGWIGDGTKTVEIRDVGFSAKYLSPLP